MKSASDITAAEFRAALESLDHPKGIKDCQREMLIEHYRAPQQICTATQLAHAVGWRSYRGVNLWYGDLAAQVASKVGYNPSAEGFNCLATLVVDQPHKRGEEIPLKLREEVAAALESLGWV